MTSANSDSPSVFFNSSASSSRILKPRDRSTHAQGLSSRVAANLSSHPPAFPSLASAANNLRSRPGRDQTLQLELTDLPAVLYVLQEFLEDGDERRASVGRRRAREDAKVAVDALNGLLSRRSFSEEVVEVTEELRSVLVEPRIVMDGRDKVLSGELAVTSSFLSSPAELVLMQA